MKEYKIMYFSLVLPDLLREQRLKSSNTKIGGAAIQWYSWLKGFKKNGHSVGLLTYMGAKDFIGDNPEFEIVESFEKNKGIPKLRILYYLIPTFFLTLKKNKPDFLFSSVGNVYAGYLGIVARILKLNYVIRIASDADVDGRIKTVLNNNKSDIFFSNIGIKLANTILAQNSYQEKILKEKYPRKNIQVVHNPFFIDEKEKLDILEILKNKSNYIAWVGNFRPVKNLSALLNVAQKLPNINFKIAGTEFKNLDVKTKEDIAKLKKCENVEFMGYLTRPELLAFISNAKALLNTSILEGFSNTFLEAWYHGTPIISTKNVNPDEIISKNNLGYVSETYEELPETIKKIFSLTKQEYSNLSKNCNSFVIENHNPIKLAKKIISFLEKNKEFC